MQIFHGDCREVLPKISQVDAVVTDPPYGLSFMGKGWDHGVPGVEFWQVIRAAMKPGAHLLAFGGTRTFHRLTCAIEDAGFEIRDCVMWVYGTGFPKSLDVSKAIDKTAGVKGTQGPMKRGGERLARLKDGKRDGGETWGNESGRNPYTTIPTTDAAKQWDGWGTALKPAWEPIILARKPLEGTVAANVLEHGVGGLNVDGCRVEGIPPSVPQAAGGSGEIYGFKNGVGRSGEMSNPEGKGRWPANLIHDGSEEVVGLFPANRPGSHKQNPTHSSNAAFGGGRYDNSSCYSDSGSAARFFYCAKANKKDRGEGNDHPTVKPTDLMRYLCRLITPLGGMVLDPFMGSGSTGKAALLEGFDFIGIDAEKQYCDIAERRLERGGYTNE